MSVSIFQAHYKDKYENEVKGHYLGSYEDLYMLHCQKVEEMKNEVRLFFLIYFVRYVRIHIHLPL